MPIYLNLFRFEAAGRPWKDAKEFQNAVNKTLFTHADQVKVSSVVNVPGLHVMTGVTGKLVDEIERSFPDNKKTHEGTNFVNKFLKEHNIHRAEYQGSHSFEGNHARKLLRVVHKMRAEVEQVTVEHNKERIFGIISVMEAFDAVVESCFSVHLVGDYEEKIWVFTNLYMALHKDHKVSVTSKAHLVMGHVIPQIHTRHPGYGIGAMTEQSFESCHHAFKIEWLKTKVDPEHSDYAQRHLDAVVR